MPVIQSAALEFKDLPGRLSADPLAGGADHPYSVRVVRIPPGPRTPHVHPRSDEVTYVADGNGTAWEADQPTEVGPGDLLLIPRGVPHATVAHESGLVLVCFFPAGDLRSNVIELGEPERS